MYVKRDSFGKIIGISDKQTFEYHELADDQSDEFLAFIKTEAKKVTQTERSLDSSDRELIRVIDDLITLLTDKGVIQFTDLPVRRTAKINAKTKPSPKET
ncbi:MAG: hypothetical protein LRY63_05170 [Nitrincola sp.]|nr:hypothetical protein [Nitrincola sp.]